MEPATPEAVSAALSEILRDDLNVDIGRVTRDSRLIDDQRVTAWTAEAEATERFPRQLIEYLGSSGVFTEKWGDGQQPDVSKLIALAYALGRLGSAKFVSLSPTTRRADTATSGVGGRRDEAGFRRLRRGDPVLSLVTPWPG